MPLASMTGTSRSAAPSHIPPTTPAEAAVRRDALRRLVGDRHGAGVVDDLEHELLAEEAAASVDSPRPCRAVEQVLAARADLAGALRRRQHGERRPRPCSSGSPARRRPENAFHAPTSAATDEERHRGR